MAVFLFFDESGNLDFSPSGTRYYIFGALTTGDPAPLSHPLSDTRYKLIADGIEIERFHATEDRQETRDQVYQILSQVGGFEFDCIIIEKQKVNPILYDPSRFYPQFANYLLQYVFNRHCELDERIVVITDTLPVKKKRKAVEKAFMIYIRKNLGRRPFTVLHHSSASHACLQAADYCNWAIHKKWKDKELRPYKEIQKFIRSEFDILKSRDEYFY